jgi:hypothetical protein
LPVIPFTYAGSIGNHLNESVIYERAPMSSRSTVT